MTHTSVGDSWTLIGKSGSVSRGVIAPFSWVLVHTRFCLCPPIFSEWVSEVAQSCSTLCNPMDWGAWFATVHRIFQARILECVAISSSRGYSRPRDWTPVSHISGRRFTVWATSEAQFSLGSAKLTKWSEVKVTPSCLTLCNAWTVFLGILQARIPDWVAYPFSSESSQPRKWTRVSFIAGRFFTNWAIREA